MAWISSEEMYLTSCQNVYGAGFNSCFQERLSIAV